MSPVKVKRVEAVPDRPAFHLSATRLRDGCPFHYQATELFGVPEVKGPAAINGTVFHDAARMYGKHLVKTGIESSVPAYERCLGYARRRHGVLIADLPEAFHIATRVFKLSWKLDLNADSHAFEVRVAIGRDFQPVDPKARVDRFGTEPDHVAEYDGGEKAKVDEYKSGFRYMEYDQAATDTQCRAYAGMYLLLNERCDEVVVDLFGPLYGVNNRSLASFSRSLIPEFKDMVRDGFDRLDRYQAEFGTRAWPTKSCYGCRFCGLACPDPYASSIYGSKHVVV